VDRGVVAGPGTAFSWSIDHVTRSVLRSRNMGRVVRAVLFWVRFLDRVSDRRFGSDAASALFFLGRRSESSLRPRDMVADYNGAQAPPPPVDEAGGGTPRSE
jgi:hypothetical protein